MIKQLLKLAAVFLGIVLVALAGLYVSLAVTEGTAVTPATVYLNSQRRPLVMAHRGGSSLRPENTFEAFDHATEIGVDVLEIDVRATRDGEFVVVHDSTVDRTTNGSGKIVEKTLSEIEVLDAGFKFTNDDGATFPYRGKGVRIPTLLETLERYEGSNINIEFKQVSEEMAAQACSMLRKGIDTAKTVIASASGGFLSMFREACPEFTTSASFTEVLDFLTRYKLGISTSYSPSMRFLQIPAGFRYLTVLDRGFASAARSKGLGIHVWTVNDEKEMKRLIRIGVDGIVTDKPDLLIRVIQETERRAPSSQISPTGNPIEEPFNQ